MRVEDNAEDLIVGELIVFLKVGNCVLQDFFMQNCVFELCIHSVIKVPEPLDLTPAHQRTWHRLF